MPPTKYHENIYKSNNLKIKSLTSLVRIVKERTSLRKKKQTFLRRSLIHSTNNLKSQIQLLQSQMTSLIVLYDIFVTIVSTVISNFFVQLLS